MNEEQLLEILASLATLREAPKQFPGHATVEWLETPRQWCERWGLEPEALVNLVEATVDVPDGQFTRRAMAGLFMLGWEAGAVQVQKVLS